VDEIDRLVDVGHRVTVTGGRARRADFTRRLLEGFLALSNSRSCPPQ